MPSCAGCGSSIPEGQRVCSMCYGDPDYGRDGYYRRYLQEAEEAEYYRRMEEERDDDDGR